MSPYIVTFLIAVFFYSVAIRMRQRSVRILLLILCVVIPSLLAGVRNLSVGTDINVYGSAVWMSAVKSGSYSDFCNSIYHIEFFYLILNYVVSRISSDIHVFFFIHQAIILSIVVLIAFRLRKRIPSEFLLMFYFLYLYNISLNLMRQSIALVVVMGVCVFVFDECNKKKAVLGTALSCVMHNSAYFSVLLFPFQHLVKKFYDNKKLMLLAVTIIGFAGFSFFAIIIYWMISIGLYSDHYELYIGQTGFKTHKIDIALLVGFIGLLLMIIKRKVRNEPFFSYAFFLAVVAIVLNLYGSIVEIAVRVAHYFVLPLSFLLPMSVKSKRTQQIVVMVSVALLLVHFIYLVFFTSMDATIPYKSDILGW